MGGICPFIRTSRRNKLTGLVRHSMILFLRSLAALALILVVTVIVLLYSCDETVETRYRTLAEAKRAGAPERGWLPPILPASAVDLHEANDLDLNRGSGGFSFDPSELEGYLKTLREQLSATSTETVGSWDVSFSKGDTRWSLRLPKNGRRATYKMKLVSLATP